MRRSLIVVALAIGCSREPSIPAPTDTRAPIGAAYVTAPDLKVYEKPDAASPVVATYQNSETVPVLVRQGEWVEIRIGDHSGWAKSSDLGDGATATTLEENPSPRFVRLPAPVTNLTAKGDVYIEADVNTDGDVVNAKVITNTTNSPALGEQNAAALRQAKFYPIVKNGTKLPFKYYHRVTY